MNPVETRKSSRNFIKSPLTEEDAGKINTYLRDPRNLIGPYGSSFQFELIPQTNLCRQGRIGTYGIVKHPQGFIAGSSINEPTKLFEFGYVFEGIILHLTLLGIGTCWLGGTFNRKDLSGSLTLAEDEIIPAISPVGYEAEGRRLKEKGMRKVLKSDQRLPVDLIFFFESFNQSVNEPPTLYQKALHYVRMGPSAMNKQPWRLLISKDQTQVHFYSTTGQANSKSFACPPELLDLGIAYRHFKEGLDECGIHGELKIENPGIQHPKELEYITTWHRN